MIPTPPPFPVEPTRRRFVDAVRELSPPWLRGGLGGAILGAVAEQLDELTDRLVAGVRLRFPGVYSPESLALIGRERRIRRGRLESDEVYTRRLGRWLDDHRRRGGGYALLAQLYAHYAPASFAIELRYASGRRYRMDAAGAVVRDRIATSGARAHGFLRGAGNWGGRSDAELLAASYATFGGVALEPVAVTGRYPDGGVAIEVRAVPVGEVGNVPNGTQVSTAVLPNSSTSIAVFGSTHAGTMDTGGPLITGPGLTGGVTGWDVPGGALPRWARWWLFYTWPTPVGDDGTWGDPGTWGDGGVWGSDLSPDEVRDLRLVPREWGAAHATSRIVLESPLETVTISVEGG